MMPPAISPTTLTPGAGINNKAFTVNTANNRLGVPGGQSGVMTYDAAGNLTNDTYTGLGNRTYDAENKITSAMGNNSQAQLYGYDASGQRIKRTVLGVETWQVYGFGGELMAEYAANGAPSTPQKEYGYRNGQLLVTAEPAAAAPINVALAANGATVTASSSFSGFAASGAINGDRKGLFVWQDGYWSTSNSSLPAWLEVQFNGSKTISEIDVVTVQDNYNAPVEPTDTMTFSTAGLSGYDVQYWNGSAWVTISGGTVTGNNKVWRKFSFAPLSTTKIRVWATASPDGYSRLTEVEAWTGPSPAPRYDLALAANGAVATASNSYNAGYGPAGAINGDRKSMNWSNGGGWNDSGPPFPDYLEVDFGAVKTVNEIHVFTLQDNYANSVEPTESTNFTLWGLTGFELQYWDGSSWVTISGASVSGNDKVWRKFTFAPLNTSKIRVKTTASVDGYSRITEVEVYGPAAASGIDNIHWLITDQLGTPRMILDQTGSLANMKRHDYLPFGEELVAGTGGRTVAQGYAGGDGVRQQFTSKERDVETGLDYFGARYYSSVQGRFISPDPIFASSRPASPQSWNRYSFCINTPMVLRDLTGLDWGVTEWTDEKGTHRNYHWFDGKIGTHKGRKYTPVNFGSSGFLDVPTENGVVRIRNTGIIRQVIYSGPSGVGTGGSSPSTLNMAAGFADGAVPFGKEIRETVFGKMGVDTSSPEYENASLISTGVSIGAQLLTGAGEAQLGVKLASGAGGASAEATMVRVIQRGEKLQEIIDEAKHLTLITGNEHALVKLASGERALVAGGPGGISFVETPITRLFGHTHPLGKWAGPSDIDRTAISTLGQRSSWLVEGFKPQKFTPN